MPLVLIKEDGTGKVDANAYANAADGDAFHDGHLYATDWTAATTGNKEKALVMATRLIDSLYQFRGYRANDGQSLQWPREFARDDDRLKNLVVAKLSSRDEYFDSDAIPKLLVNATIETARELIKTNRTDDPDGEGIRRLTLSATLAVTFGAADRRPIIPHVAQAMLSKLGDFMHKNTGPVRLVRV